MYNNILPNSAFAVINGVTSNVTLKVLGKLCALLYTATTLLFLNWKCLAIFKTGSSATALSTQNLGCSAILSLPLWDVGTLPNPGNVN